MFSDSSFIGPVNTGSLASEIVKLNDSENSPRALLSEIARTDQ